MKSAFAVSFPVLVIAYGVAAIANFSLSVLLGRSMGAAALGTFALANSVARIFYAATDFGAAPYLTRIVARERGRAGELLSIFVSSRLAFIVVALAVSYVAALVSGSHEPLVFVLVTVAQGCISLQIVYEAMLQAYERQPLAAALGIVTSICVLGANVGWYFRIGGLVPFAALYAGASVCGISIWIAKTRSATGVSARWRLSVPELQQHVGRSWPIGASFLLSNAALRAPVLALGWFGSAREIGTYVAVDMFVTAATIVQTAVTNATYPTLAASYTKEPREFRRMLWLSNALLAGIGLVAALFLVLFGDFVLAHVFPSKEFVGTAVLIPIVGWSTPILLLVHHNIFIFAATDHERLNLRFMTMYFASVAIMELALVPHWGLIGAAWGVLLARLVSLFLLGATVFAARIHTGQRT